MSDNKPTKVVAIEVIELQLGEKIYQVSAAGLTRSEKWRGRLQVEINAILNLLKEQGGAIDLGNLKSISEMGLTELVPIIGAALARLNISMSALGELICLYSPDLEKDEAVIKEFATTQQAVAALKEMIQLEYPFGMIFNPQSRRNGLAAATTLANWPSPSGESAPLN